MLNFKIHGVGNYLPDRVISNEEELRCSFPSKQSETYAGSMI